MPWKNKNYTNKTLMRKREHTKQKIEHQAGALERERNTRNSIIYPSFAGKKEKTFAARRRPQSPAKIQIIQMLASMAQKGKA